MSLKTEFPKVVFIGKKIKEGKGKNRHKFCIHFFKLYFNDDVCSREKNKRKTLD